MLDEDRLKEFEAQMERLGELFIPLGDDQKDVYFERFKGVEARVLKLAVDVLIDQHPYKRFPIPAEIWKAIEKVRQAEAAAKAPRPPVGTAVCGDCGNTGWKIKEIINAEYPKGHSVAAYCHCILGQRMKAGHAKHAQEQIAERRRARLKYPDREEVVSEANDDEVPF